MKDIVLVGSSGFAKEVRWLIEECNSDDKRWNILGWISKEPPGTIVAGLPVLGDDDWLIDYQKPIDVAISVGNGFLRRKIVERYVKNQNISFPNIIAPSAQMSRSVDLGVGCIVTAQSIFTVDIKIGDFLISNLASTIGHDCKIGNYVTLFPGVHVSGNVTLGDCTSVGTGANIIQGLTVGENSFIGAGAAVVKNIPSNCTAVGIPAKPLVKKNE